MEIDEIGVLRVPKITKTFAQDEFLQLSMKLIKTNEYGSQNNRYLVLTNKRILLLNKTTIRRKVPLNYLIAITMSNRSFEFILHFKDLYDDDDLRLVTDRRAKVIETIVKTFSQELNQQLPSFEVPNPNLKQYVTYKQDRNKNLKKLPNEPPKFLFYKPIAEENERKSQLKKLQEATYHDKLIYAADHEVKYELSDFVLVRVLMEGSVSQVLLVENQQTKTQYAMKCIAKHNCEQLDLSAFQSLENYRRNPFLVKLEYCYESELKFFFIQRLMKQDLFKKLQDVKKFDEEKLRFYACEIILALEHLHELGIVYGDLKPENVLLDAQNHVCLCDFGYLRARKKNIKGVYGTPEYMAPETLQNHSNQLYYTDFWQLGILLFELLYSHPPFMGRDYDQLFDFILNCPIEFPVSVPSSDAIKDLLFRLLKKDPKERIGYIGGVPEIQGHVWFKDINWKERYERQVPAPEWRSLNLMELNQQHNKLCQQQKRQTMK